MDRLAWGIVAVTLLAAFAGCNAFQGDRGTYDVPTLTTAADGEEGAAGRPGDESGGDADATLTEQPGLAPPIRAPSIARQAVPDDPRAMTDDHAAFLANRSFVVQVDRRIRYGNGTREEVALSAWVGADRRQYRLVRVDRPPGKNGTVVFEVWADREDVYRSVVAAGDEDVWRYPSPLVAVGTATTSSACLPSWIPDPTYREAIRVALAGADVDRVGTVDNGANPRLAFFRGTANGTRPVATGGSPATNASIEVVVDARGLVRHFRIEYETTVAGTPASVALALSFEAGAPGAWTGGSGTADAGRDADATAGAEGGSTGTDDGRPTAAESGRDCDRGG